MTERDALESAYALLQDSLLYYRGQPIGTVAALDPHLAAVNYGDCFVRDFVPSALVFLMEGRAKIVRNFLVHVLELQGKQREMEGHEAVHGLMPASFRVISTPEGEQTLQADFGDLAIGRVAPVDSAMWWMILLRLYTLVSGEVDLARTPQFQEGMREMLRLYLQESFETSPAMLVPDGSFMIDRRMGVYGHPLEIQVLLYAMLMTAQELLIPNADNEPVLHIVRKRAQALRSYVRIFYWLDVMRLNEIHRFKGEEFGPDATNLLNIYPESIPDWLDDWLAPDCGYLVGNLGPGRIDFRFFAFGNLLAVLFGLATDEQAAAIFRLYEHRWDELAGQMPVKILYPAASGAEWAFMTGSDPKNVAWSYHNGGNWPALLWAFCGAAIRAGRSDLAQRACETTLARLPRDHWPEYYDGRHGSLIGRRANLRQTWSATSWIVAHRFLEQTDSVAVFEALLF